MVEFKVVTSDPKTGLSVQTEVKEPAAKAFLGLKIGETIKGEVIDLQGYEFELTGGSDFCGFPMRRDVQGVGRKRILAYSGVGVRKGEKGMLQRKTVCGNTIHVKIAQINLKAIKIGANDIFANVRAKAEATKADRVAKKSGAKKAFAPKEEAPVTATA